MCTAFYNKEHHPAVSEAVENGTETPQKDSVQEVRWERERHLRKEYPYYCPGCDENMYSFECMEVQTSGGFGNAGSK